MENTQNCNNNNNRLLMPLELLFEIFKTANTRQENGCGEYLLIFLDVNWWGNANRSYKKYPVIS